MNYEYVKVYNEP